jgi:hypothetical protein
MSGGQRALVRHDRQLAQLRRARRSAAVRRSGTIGRVRNSDALDKAQMCAGPARASSQVRRDRQSDAVRQSRHDRQVRRGQAAAHACLLPPPAGEGWDGGESERKGPSSRQQPSGQGRTSALAPAHARPQPRQPPRPLLPLRHPFATIRRLCLPGSWWLRPGRMTGSRATAGSHRGGRPTGHRLRVALFVSRFLPLAAGGGCSGRYVAARAVAARFRVASVASNQVEA